MNQSNNEVTIDDRNQQPPGTFQAFSFLAPELALIQTSHCLWDQVYTDPRTELSRMRAIRAFLKFEMELLRLSNPGGKDPEILATHSACKKLTRRIGKWIFLTVPQFASEGWIDPSWLENDPS